MVIANHHDAVYGYVNVHAGHYTAAFEFVTASIGPHPLQRALLILRVQGSWVARTSALR